MINPISGPVLATSALVSMPALWSVWRGSMPLDVGLSRFLVVQLGCWIAACAVTAALGLASDGTAGAPEDADGPEMAGAAGPTRTGVGSVVPQDPS